MLITEQYVRVHPSLSVCVSIGPFFFITPPQNRGGVILSLQFVCVPVCQCVCVTVCPALLVNKFQPKE